ncbi:MAG: winged helix-turn-helix domain-containing protein [Phormidium sp.]
MSILLSEVLELVGKLDDSEGGNTPRERFRSRLKTKVTHISQLREYIEEGLSNSGEQYSRALQDLVNRLGELLGFQVIYGRYKGVQGQNGFDGHWISSKKNFHIVVEVKSSEVYPIKTSTLVGYIDHLISDRQIPSWDEVSGLYVVGRIDDDIRQLENRIIAEKKTPILRSISVKSLLSLAEMMNQYNLSHEGVLSIIRPSTPRIDSLVSLMNSLVVKLEPLDRKTTEIVNDDFSESEILDDEILDDEILDDEILDDEILDDEILDDEQKSEENKRPNKRNKTKRLPRGKRTPNSAYYLPILKVIADFGGAAKTGDVLSRVEKLMSSILKEVDYQMMPSAPQTPRWNNSARWARQEMVNQGLLKSGSPTGIWEISDKGWQYLADKNSEST